MDLRTFIRNVPDFPKPGIQFKDITPLLANQQALSHAVSELAAPFKDAGVTVVAGVESRGFIFGPLVARELGAGFIPVRKPGKLPYKTHKMEYELEYGTDALEIHQDAVQAGDKVLVIDDLIATGGTLWATAALFKKLQANVVGFGLLIELDALEGRKRLDGAKVVSLIHY